MTVLKFDAHVPQHGDIVRSNRDQEEANVLEADFFRGVAPTLAAGGPITIEVEYIFAVQDAPTFVVDLATSAE